MKVNMTNRLIILSNLPEKSDIFNMLISRQIRCKLDISESDMDMYEIRKVDNNIVWNHNVDESNQIDVDFNEDQLNLIKTIYKTLSDNKLLTDNMLDFAIKILNYE